MRGRGPARGRPTREVLYARLEYELRELREKLGGLPRGPEAETIWRDIWVHEAHNSTAIEGNTLDVRQVEALLNEGKAVGHKELREYLEVAGYASAADWVYSQALEPGADVGASLLTLTEVRQVHRLVMAQVWDVAPHPRALPEEAPGSFRRHNLVPFTGGMQPPEFTEVPPLMSDWVADVNAIMRDERPIPEAIAIRHAAFERIHPFLDGNGRTGRLLVNLVLVRLGYPPAIIQKRERSRYLEALRRADAEDPAHLGEIIARAVLDNLLRFVIPSVAGPARLVPLESLATNEISAHALSQAASRGRLKAVRDEHGRYRSTRTWVEEYLRHRYVPLAGENRSSARARAPQRRG